jgi:hypothetical protein
MDPPLSLDKYFAKDKHMEVDLPPSPHFNFYVEEHSYAMVKESHQGDAHMNLLF